MNILTQEAKKKQAAVKFAIRKGKSEASRRYGVSLSTWTGHTNCGSRQGFNSFLHSRYDELLDICQEQRLWFEQGIKRILSLAEKKYYIYGCPSTPKGSMIRILPDGTVTLCENMGLRGLYHLGNVNDGILSVEEINNNPLFLMVMKNQMFIILMKV